MSRHREMEVGGKESGDGRLLVWGGMRSVRTIPLPSARFDGRRADGNVRTDHSYMASDARSRCVDCDVHLLHAAQIRNDLKRLNETSYGSRGRPRGLVGSDRPD